MLKHIARHNQKKAIVVYRELPSEDHMALIVYTETLPVAIHDNLMRAVESPEGQSTPDLSNVLFRTLTNEGEGILQSLHKSGWLKKVPTNQVIVTPTSNATVRLDELNKLLTEMSKGDEAVKRLKDIEDSKGMTGKQNRRSTVFDKEVGVPPNSRAGEVDMNLLVNSAAPADSVLSDADLAAQRLSQANNMKQQAEQLLAEAKRLETEANELAPAKNVKPTRTTKKTAAAKKQAA
jgi:hypothetical protein